MLLLGLVFIAAAVCIRGSTHLLDVGMVLRSACARFFPLRFGSGALGGMQGGMKYDAFLDMVRGLDLVSAVTGRCRIF